MEICRFWREGRCNRRPCPYLHADLPCSWRAARTPTAAGAVGAPSIRPSAARPASKILKENRAPPTNHVLSNKNTVNCNVTGRPNLRPKTTASVRCNGGGSTWNPGANSIHCEVAEESAPAAKIESRLPKKRAGARDDVNGCAATAGGCLRNNVQMNTNIAAKESATPAAIESRMPKKRAGAHDDVNGRATSGSGCPRNNVRMNTNIAAKESATPAAIESRLPKKRAGARDDANGRATSGSVCPRNNVPMNTNIAAKESATPAEIESRLPKKRAIALDEVVDGPVATAATDGCLRNNARMDTNIGCSQSKTIHYDLAKESATPATIESWLSQKRARACDEVDDGSVAAAATAGCLKNSQSKKLKKQDGTGTSCVNDDPPEYSTTSKCFSLLADLGGHKKEIVGMAVPPNSNKLYTASRDGLFKIWDCETAQCIKEENIGCEINCLFNNGEETWLFVATNNFVLAWNTESGSSFRLNVLAGQVLVVETFNNMVFAGMQDGTILVWKATIKDEKNSEPIAILPGHDGTVVSMVVGKKHLYSGSTDNTIRQWDLKTLECTNILKGHNSVVTSLLCWHEHLISSSLDRTIKAWCYTENGLESIYSHREEHTALELCGMHDEEGKPILICSYNNNSVHLYDLPSFSMKGKIIADERISSIHKVPGPLDYRHPIAAA